MTDLLSLTLRLCPLANLPPRPLPTWWGDAAHQAAFDLFHRENQEWGKSIHAAKTKPFTASTLRGRFDGQQLIPTNEYTLQLTSTRADVTACLLAALQPGAPLSDGQTLELDYIPFTINGADLEAPPLTFTELHAAQMFSPAPLQQQVCLLFTSPTLFKSNGLRVLLPLPELVFGSLIDRWNAFAPPDLQVPTEARFLAQNQVEIIRHELKTIRVQEEGKPVVGFVGQVAYHLFFKDRYWLAMFHTLAAFSRYCGVGRGVAKGFGQCLSLSMT